MMWREPNMTLLNAGLRVGRWSIVGLAPIKARQSQRLRPHWRCRCDCGTEKEVLAQSLLLALRSSAGGSRSCGCLLVDRATRHGNSRGKQPTPEYSAWIAAKKRCSNPRNASYKDYGARGIRMCLPWAASFETFLRDMGPRPSAEHSLDRIDPDEDYEPGNCRWASRIVQARNKRNVRWYAFEGELLVLADLAARLGITRDQARALERRGRLPARHSPDARGVPARPTVYRIDLNEVPPFGRSIDAAPFSQAGDP